MSVSAVAGPRLFGRSAMVLAAVVMVFAALLCPGHHHDHTAGTSDLHVADSTVSGAVSHAHHGHECGPGGLPSAAAQAAAPAVPEPGVLTIGVPSDGETPGLTAIDTDPGTRPPVAGTQLLTRVCVARR
jgi:hypothetical protein